MNQNKLRLGAFWVSGNDQPFFGLRDAKNFQLLKGGSISGPDGAVLYPDPFPEALNCTKCNNRILPQPILEGEEVRPPQTVCNDCGGARSPVVKQEKESKKSGGIFGFFKRS